MALGHSSGARWRARLAAILALIMAQSALAAVTPASAAAIVSVKRGPWSSASTWNVGRVPGSSDVVTIRHRVKLDRNARVGGVTIRPRGRLVFAARKSPTLTSSGNVVVAGTLRMRPASARKVHTLVFTGINEAAFQGGGHMPLATDVGLWVRPRGLLATTGTEKTSWTRASRSISAGATSFTVQDAAGWRSGDEIVLGPTRPEERRDAFEVLTIDTVDPSSGRVTLTSPTARAHADVDLPNGTTLSPEVLNLTRNVRIEGTAAGRSHIHIFGARRQTIRHVALRHMGVPDGDNTTTGRYALHFHHAHNRSRGTLVEGVVARDVGTHAFVPHASHGITFRETIAYNFDDAAYWWDQFEADGSVSLTHDTVYEDCIAASGRGWGILHQFGLDNIMDGCVVYGIDNTPVGAAGRGFAWNAEPHHVDPFRPIHTVWEWRDGIAHNVGNPLWIWQIDREAHNITRPIVYWPLPLGDRRNGAQLHGAYRNVYHFSNGVMLGDIALELHAASGIGHDGIRRQEHRRMIYDAAGGQYAIRITRHEIAGAAFGLITDCRLENFTRAAVVINENTANRFSRGGDYTFRHCVKGDGIELAPQDFEIQDLHPESEICIEQESGLAWMIDGSGSAYTTTPVRSCP